MSTDRLFDEKKPEKKEFKLDNNTYFKAGPTPLTNHHVGLVGMRKVNKPAPYILQIYTEQLTILEHKNVDDIIPIDTKSFATLGGNKLRVWNFKDYSYREVDGPLCEIYQYHHAICIAQRYIISIYQHWQQHESKLIHFLDTRTMETNIFDYESSAASWNTPWKLNLCLLKQSKIAVYGGGQHGLMLFDFAPDKETWLSIDSTILNGREIVFFLPWQDNAFWAIYEVNNPSFTNGLTQWFPKLTVAHVKNNSVMETLLEREAFLDHTQPKLYTGIVDGSLVYNSGGIGVEHMAVYNPYSEVEFKFSDLNGKHTLIIMPNDDWLIGRLDSYSSHLMHLPINQKTQLEKAIENEMKEAPTKVLSLIADYALPCRFFPEKPVAKENKNEPSNFISRWVGYYLWTSPLSGSDFYEERKAGDETPDLSPK